MILPIYIYGQPVLRKVAEDITPDYPELKELINNMYETLDSSNGIGLAAPQIGLAIRLVVIDLDVLSDDLPEYKGSVMPSSILISLSMMRRLRRILLMRDVSLFLASMRRWFVLPASMCSIWMSSFRSMMSG